MVEIEERETTRRNPLLWPVRFLLHWIIKLIVLVFLGIRAVLRPKPVRFGIVALLLAGIVAWYFEGPAMLGRSGGTGTAPAAQAAPAAQSAASSSGTGVVSVSSTVKLDRNPVVEQYLKAQSNFDANGMWDTISDDLKNQLAQSNTSKNDLQTELDAAKQAGRQYVRATYVGGVPLDANQNAYFYVLTIDTANGTQQIPYTYVVGSDGKIISIQ